MKPIKSFWDHLLYISNILFCKVVFGSRFKRFGRRVIISPKLFQGKNLENVVIGDDVKFRYGARIETFPEFNKDIIPELIIGSGTKIETSCHLGCSNKIVIGTDVLIGSNVFISDHDHSFNNREVPIRNQGIFCKGPVIIGKNSWIGNNVTILSNVSIGRNCVIGANSVVNMNIPDYSIAAGVPAKVIKTIPL